MNPFEGRITLTRRSGEARVFELRRCTEADLCDIMSLQQQVSERLHDPDIYVPINEDDFRESLMHDHFFGVYYEGRLIAATLMIDNRVSHRNYGTYVGYPPERLPDCVSMETTFVDEKCRGFGLQAHLTALRESYARELGATESFVTISPRNEHSLRNLMSMGYEILETRPLYGDAVRHILRKYL